MSIEDRLSREAVKDMLKEINKKMFTQKKEAITKFISYIKAVQPKLSPSTVEYLFVGERKLPGIVQAIGHLNWKGQFHKYTNVLLDLVQILLSSDYEHNKIARKVFLRLEPSQLSGLCLHDHMKKKSGNMKAAEWILNFATENGRTIADSNQDSKRSHRKTNSAVPAQSLTSSSDNALIINKPQQQQQKQYHHHMKSTSAVILGTVHQKHASTGCVTSDAKKKKGFMNFLSGFFNKRPDQKALVKQGIMKAASVFGAPLDAVIQSFGKNGLPAVVVDCVEKLQRDHLTHEGLFRIPGNNTTIIQLKQKYDYGESVNMFSETANDVSGLLKLYLRDMPEPLFPWDMYDSFLNAWDTVREDGGAGLRAVAKSIPPSRQRLMKYLFNYFHILSLNHAINKMKARNIAICLAPNVLRPKVETLQSVAHDAPAVTGIVRWFIEDAKPGSEQTGTTAGAAGAQTDASQQNTIEKKSEATIQSSASIASVSATGTPTVAQQPLPEGWQEVTRDGKTYYYNHERKYSQWERPSNPQEGLLPIAEGGIETPRGTRSMRLASGIISPKKKPPPFRKKGNSMGDMNSLSQSMTGSGRGTREIRTSTAPVQQANPGLDQDLPEGWSAHLERNSGKVYYFNTATRKSQWTKPN